MDPVAVSAGLSTCERETDGGSGRGVGMEGGDRKFADTTDVGKPSEVAGEAARPTGGCGSALARLPPRRLRWARDRGFEWFGDEWTTAAVTGEWEG